MSSEGKSVAAQYALDLIAEAEYATKGQPPDAAQLIAKAQVYAILAVAEAIETAEVESPVFGRE